MFIEIIRPDGDLKREVWVFYLSIDYKATIYLDSFSFQAKKSSRHRKWLKQTHWQRLDKRSNNICRLPIPSDVEAEMRSMFQDFIKTLPIE